MHQAFCEGFEKLSGIMDVLEQRDISNKLLAAIGKNPTLHSNAARNISEAREELNRRIQSANATAMKKSASAPTSELLRYGFPTAVGALGGAAIGAAASPEDRARGAKRGILIGGVTGAARPAVQQLRAHLMKKYPEQTKAMLRRYSPEMSSALMTAGPELAAAGAGALTAAATN
jgi:ABC-type transporter Mla subunit MlaD